MWLVGKSVGLSYSWSCFAGDRETIVGIFHPIRQLARFSQPNMSYNIFRISPDGKAVNYRPYTSP